EPAEGLRQSEWVTRMARLAATEFGADWVINTDADEFWWPRGGSLKDVLAAVPDRYGIVHAFWRSFVPRPDDLLPAGDQGGPPGGFTGRRRPWQSHAPRQPLRSAHHVAPARGAALPA